MQLNLGSLFNIVWNINFLLKKLLWKIHQTSQNQWLPYRENPGGRICRNCFMRASATRFFVLDCLSVGRNQWFSLHHRGTKVWGQTASYQYSECGLNISLLSLQHVPRKYHLAQNFKGLHLAKLWFKIDTGDSSIIFAHLDAPTSACIYLSCICPFVVIISLGCCWR